MAKKEFKTIKVSSLKTQIQTSDMFTFNNIGDKLCGYFLGSKENVGENNSRVHTLKVQIGTTWQNVSIWGSSTLDTKLAKLKTLSPCVIVYNGKAKKASKGKHPAKLYDVFVAGISALN